MIALPYSVRCILYFLRSIFYKVRFLSLFATTLDAFPECLEEVIDAFDTIRVMDCNEIDAKHYLSYKEDETAPELVLNYGEPRAHHEGEKEAISVVFAIFRRVEEFIDKEFFPALLAREGDQDTDSSKIQETSCLSRSYKDEREEEERAQDHKAANNK